MEDAELDAALAGIISRESHLRREGAKSLRDTEGTLALEETTGGSEPRGNLQTTATT